MMTDREAYIAFNLTDRVGPAKVKALVARFGSVVQAWENYPEKVSRMGGEVDWEGEIKRAKKYGVELVTPADTAYPKRLEDAHSRPLCLYVKGSVEVLSKPSIAMVGTRKCTAYGRKMAQKLSGELARSGWTIVSGLALGIDAASHEAAVEANGITVGVIGSGLDKFYPEENRELARRIVKAGGAVISQFPFGKEASKEAFPIRNHVIAALSIATIAVETPLTGGTLLTCEDAAELGRIVMAVPGRADDKASKGCNKLIRKGAILVEDLDQIIEAVIAQSPELAAAQTSAQTGEISVKPLEMPTYTLEESLIMRLVDEVGVSVDKIVRESSLPLAKVNSLLMELRLKGRIKFLPGNRVAEV